MGLEPNISQPARRRRNNVQRVKPPLYSRPTTNDTRGRRMLRFFFELPVAASDGGCPTHAGPSCVPTPSFDGGRPMRPGGFHRPECGEIRRDI